MKATILQACIWKKPELPFFCYQMARKVRASHSLLLNGEDTLAEHRVKPKYYISVSGRSWYENFVS